MIKTALVTGAAGALGPLLVEGLLRAGYHVRALVRRTPEKPVFDDSVQIITGDITRKEDVVNAIQGTSLVFHLAAKLHMNDPDPGLEESYFRVNTFGTQLVADACVAAGVERLIFFSTICVYGENRGKEVVTESSSVNPGSFYAKSKKQAEDIVLATRKKGDPAIPIGVVMRVAAVYGSSMKGNYKTLFSAIRSGLFLPVGPGKNRRTLIYETDLVQAAILCANHPSAAGRIYNVTDGSVHSLNEILTSMYQALGKRKPGVSLPEKPVRLAANMIDAVLALSGRKRGPVTRMVDKFFEDVAVSGDRFRKEIGFNAAYTLEQGFLETMSK